MARVMTRRATRARAMARATRAHATTPGGIRHAAAAPRRTDRTAARRDRRTAARRAPRIVERPAPRPRPSTGARPARRPAPSTGARPAAPARPYEARPPRPGPRPYDRAFDRPIERSFDRRPPGPPARRPIEPREPALTLAEDEEIVAGRRPVEEAFVARREARRLLVVPQRRHALEKLVLHATSLRIPVVEVEGGTLTAVAGFDGHQGIALVVGPRPWAAPDDILALAAQRGEPPLVLVLDSLEDPQNVGTLLRTRRGVGRPRRDLPDPPTRRR